MKLIQVRNYEEMSHTACSYILDKLKAIENPVLGLSTGATPEGLYRYLIQSYQEKKVSFQNLKTFNLDEYINLDKNHPNSYFHYMQKRFFQYVDILEENQNLPNGKAENLKAECQAYEDKISQAGKIDLQVLGIGVNGHIGFNEPGTAFTSRTHVVTLDDCTRTANAKYFASLNEVPSKAITMGIKTIMESKEIVLLVTGRKKASALKRLLNGEVDEEFPASILKIHPNATIIADEKALIELS
ncbi:glucosamine-6-phosphate deaminase [Lysinibacillus fusiformis]|nr:glucosamine-6-phosphate deaminase [Lysinibacillus fusiformis]